MTALLQAKCDAWGVKIMSRAQWDQLDLYERRSMLALSCAALNLATGSPAALIKWSCFVVERPIW
jgi:hypothetical protein